MESVLLRPHLNTRSTADLNRTFRAGALLMLELLALPLLVAAAVYTVSRSTVLALVGGIVVFYPLSMVLSIVVTLSTVHWLRIDAAGLTFGRALGRHRRLPWGSITEIAPAPADEVVRRGWLWPPVPPREATRSMSAEGHFRIRTRERVLYYPPADEAALRAAIERWQPRLLVRSASAAELRVAGGAGPGIRSDDGAGAARRP